MELLLVLQSSRLQFRHHHRLSLTSSPSRKRCLRDWHPSNQAMLRHHLCPLRVHQELLKPWLLRPLLQSLQQRQLQEVLPSKAGHQPTEGRVALQLRLHFPRRRPNSQASLRWPMISWPLTWLTRKEISWKRYSWKKRSFIDRKLLQATIARAWLADLVLGLQWPLVMPQPCQWACHRQDNRGALITWQSILRLSLLHPLHVLQEPIPRLRVHLWLVAAESVESRLKSTRITTTVILVINLFVRTALPTLMSRMEMWVQLPFSVNLNRCRFDVKYPFCCFCLFSLDLSPLRASREVMTLVCRKEKYHCMLHTCTVHVTNVRETIGSLTSSITYQRKENHGENNIPDDPQENGKSRSE